MAAARLLKTLLLYDLPEAPEACLPPDRGRDAADDFPLTMIKIIKAAKSPSPIYIEVGLPFFKVGIVVIRR